MAVSNGQRADEDNFNNAFLCKATGGEIVGTVTLNNPADGAAVNVQADINQNKADIASNDTDIAFLQASKQDLSEKDQANGYAGLDADGKISSSALPFEAVEFKGAWDATTNTPTLADGTGDIGDIYRVNVAGNQDLGSGAEDYALGDWVTYNGTVWERSDFVGAGVISDLADVDTSTNPPSSDLDVLGWDNTNSLWVPKKVASQENIAWVPQGLGTWDATAFDFVLSEDCFLSVPPLDNTFHTILAQTINFPNDGDVAFVTVDRAAAATTNLTVTVTPIGSFVNDGNNIIICRRVGAELFIGLHDPQRFQDGDEFDLSKGGGGFTGAREANVIERKILSANVTGTGPITEIGWDNLVIGKTYEVRGQFTLRNDVGAADADVRVDANHNGGNLGRTRLRLRESTDTSDDVVILTMAFSFTAADTVLEFLPSSPSAASDILGNGDRSGTYVELETRNDLETNAIANNDLTVVTAKAEMHLTANQTITSSGSVKALYDASSYDTAGMFNATNSSLVVPRDGFYTVCLGVNLASVTTDERVNAEIRVDGVLAVSRLLRAGVTDTPGDLTKTIQLFKDQEITVTFDSTVDTNYIVRGSTALNYVTLTEHPDFSVYGVLNPETEIVETEITSFLPLGANNNNVWLFPGVALSITLSPGTWDITSELYTDLVTSGGNAIMFLAYSTSTSPGVDLIQRFRAATASNNGSLTRNSLAVSTINDYVVTTTTTIYVHAQAQNISGSTGFTQMNLGGSNLSPGRMFARRIK